MKTGPKSAVDDSRLPLTTGAAGHQGYGAGASDQPGRRRPVAARPQSTQL